MCIQKKYLISVIFFLLIGLQSYAEKKIFTFSSDYTEAVLAKGKEYTLLRGNAKVTADDVEITASEIKLYGDDFQFAEVLGNFSAYDLKNDFSLEGRKLLYDRTKKLLRAEGNILMKDNKNNIVIRSHFLESKNDGDFMVVQLGVRITKENDLSARTEFLTYYRETNILEMSGFPYALWKEDEYKADRISINLDTDEVVLEGKVQGFISTTQEKENGTKEEQSTEEKITNTEVIGGGEERTSSDNQSQETSTETPAEQISQQREENTQ